MGDCKASLNLCTVVFLDRKEVVADGEVRPGRRKRRLALVQELQSVAGLDRDDAGSAPAVRGPLQRVQVQAGEREVRGVGQLCGRI